MKELNNSEINAVSGAGAVQDSIVASFTTGAAAFYTGATSLFSLFGITEDQVTTAATNVGTAVGAIVEAKISFFDSLKSYFTSKA